MPVSVPSMRMTPGPGRSLFGFCPELICALSVMISPALCDDVTAWTGARIETVGAAGTIERGTVVVRNGVIDAVGADIEIPDDARVIDASNRTIIPAMLDVYHPVSLQAGGSESESRTITVNGRTFTIPSSAASTSTAWQKIADNLDPLTLKSDLQTASRTGVAFANLVTRGYGQSVHVRVTPLAPETCVTENDGLLYLAVTNETSSLDVLRNGLAGRSSSTSGRPSGPPGGGGRSGRTPPGREPLQSGDAQPAASTGRGGPSSPTSAVWASVISGDRPLLLNVNNAAALLYCLDILKPYDKVKTVVVAGSDDIYRTMDQLRGRRVSVLMAAGLSTVPNSQDRINVAERLAEAGISFGFSPSLTAAAAAVPDSPLFPAALMIRTGLSREKALAALTLVPATMLGLDKSYGSIEKGKQANLLVFDGDPFSASSRIRQMTVEGRLVYED